MKNSKSPLLGTVGVFGLVCACSLVSPITASAEPPVERGDVAQVGAGTTFVNSQFGGSIFGFDIDQNGTEGVLTEGQLLPNGKTLAAVETFDQATGKILKVVQKTENNGDFLTEGVVGTSIGLVEHEEVTHGIYVTNRVYEELSPLDKNKRAGTWKPPLTVKDIILGVSRTQGFATTAVFYFQNGQFTSSVFGSNVGANTFGPIVNLTDQLFGSGYSPVMAYDTVTNEAVIATSTGAVGGPAPQIALANLTTGDVTQFTGIPEPPLGPGSVNGIAVDSEDGIAVTATELNGNITFYDLAKKTGFLVALPDAGQLTSGTDVEFDPVNKLFFVAQEVSGTAPGSSIQVYDTKGNFVESLNGFNFSDDSSVIGTYIALNPGNRTGYINSAGPQGTQGGTLQSFTY
jgi:WD40 repeat protein